MLKNFPDEKSVIVNFNHTALERKYSDIRTIGNAYDTGYIKLNELAVIYGRETPVMLIESWIMQLSLFLDIEIDADRIKETAWLIYDDNHFLNIAELTLLFTRIKKGYFGEFYNRIDPSSLLSWCREYRKERGMYVSKLP